MNKLISTILGPLALFSVSASAQHTDSTAIFRTLDEAVIMGWTGSTTAKLFPVPVSVIGNAELSSYSSTNIIDALSRQPGISQITTGGAISKPVIRGLGYNRIVVINDGIRQEGQQWGDEHGIEIDAQSVNSVEIIKGPASLLYGSDAMSGVIIFDSTPVAMPGSIVTNISNEYQTNNGLIGNSIYNAGHIGDIVWDARISQKDAHAYQNKTDGFVLNSGFSERAGSGMIGINKKWGYSHLRFGTYYLMPGLIEGEREDDGSFVNESGLKDKSYKLGLPFQKIGHSKVVSESSIRLGEGSLKLIAGYQLNDRREFEEEEDECSLFFRLHSVNYDMHYRSPEINGWRFVGGVTGMYQHSLNLGEEYLIPEYNLFDAGVFGTMQKSFEKWSISGGLRFDERKLHSYELYEEGELRFQDFERSFPGLSGSIGLSYFPSKKLQLKFDVARGFRAPNISELASNGVHEGTLRYELGSNSLKSENSLQLDLGLDYTTDRVSLTAALFANRINNFIFSQRSPNNEVIDEHDLFVFIQNDAFIYGGEIGLCWSILSNLHMDSSFSYVSGELISSASEEQKWLPMIPAPRANLGLKYMLNLKSNSFKETYCRVGFENNFKKTHIHSAYGTETETPGYFLLNVTIGTDIYMKGKKLLTVCINGENLTNKAYQNHLSRLKYTDENPVTGKMGIFNMGRNIGIKLLWNLEYSSNK